MLPEIDEIRKNGSEEFKYKGLDVVRRQADAYIYCLLDHKTQETLDPMNLDQWEFYIVKTSNMLIVSMMN